MPEKVVIIGSGPAGWTAAIYAARANLEPLVFEGALTPENHLKGTLPLGQLALTTEVENYPGLPSGDSREYLRTALPPDRQPHWVLKNRPQPGHGINGPEMMELMRQQASNFGTRIITDDIVRVDFRGHPFRLFSLEGQTIETLAVIIATGRGPITSACRRKTASRTMACPPARFATVPCRASATSRSSWSAAATRRWKRAPT